MSKSPQPLQMITFDQIDSATINNAVIGHRPLIIMLKAFNKPILIWIETIERKQNEPLYVMDDNGKTFDQWSSIQIAQKQPQIHEILNQYDIRKPDDRLIVHSDVQHIKSQLQRLLKAIIEIQKLK